MYCILKPARIHGPDTAMDAIRSPLAGLLLAIALTAGGVNISPMWCLQASRPVAFVAAGPVTQGWVRWNSSRQIRMRLWSLAPGHTRLLPDAPRDRPHTNAGGARSCAFAASSKTRPPESGAMAGQAASPWHVPPACLSHELSSIPHLSHWGSGSVEPRHLGIMLSTVTA